LSIADWGLPIGLLIVVSGFRLRAKRFRRR
jgi:hypothetical protein